MLSTISREVQQSTLGKFKFTMEINKDFRFEVSISKDAYKSKAETNAAIMGDNEGRVQRKNLGLKDKLCFKTQTVMPQELLDLALHGYTFCHRQAMGNKYPADVSRNRTTDGHHRR